MSFGKEYRKLLAEEANLSNKQISKVLDEQWRQLDSPVPMTDSPKSPVLPVGRKSATGASD